MALWPHRPKSSTTPHQATQPPSSLDSCPTLPSITVATIRIVVSFAFVAPPTPTSLGHITPIPQLWPRLPRDVISREKHQLGKFLQTPN
jgi:hypothetical protein